MATNTFVEIDIPEAAELADYTGIWYDLISAREFARTLLNASGKETTELVTFGPTDDSCHRAIRTSICERCTSSTGRRQSGGPYS